MMFKLPTHPNWPQTLEPWTTVYTRLTLILDNLLLAWSNTLEASRCNRLSRFHLKFMKTCFAFLWLQNTCHYFWRWLYMLSIFIDAFFQGFACTPQPQPKCQFDETISNSMNIRFIYYDLCFTTKYKWSNIGDIVYPVDLTKKTAHSQTHCPYWPMISQFHT